MEIKKEEVNREKQFRRNSDLENLLSELNDELSCSERNALEKIPTQSAIHPIIFIMGPHRSGTTLFLQWLANTGLAAYPTNLLSRFYMAPVIGAKIQLLLTDNRYNFRNEILDFNSEISYSSANGKTTGALSPNEFWYFWRRFLPFKELDWLPNEELHRSIDKALFSQELYALAEVFDKPFALKGLILNYNIPFLDEVFKNVLFIQMKREPVSNIASILEARKRQLGHEEEWYSFKIPEYEKLKNLDPVTQTSGQLHYINKAVDLGMSGVSEGRKLTVNYEDFCKNPQQVFNLIASKLNRASTIYNGPVSFDISRNKDIKNASEIKKALNSYTDT